MGDWTLLARCNVCSQADEERSDIDGYPPLARQEGTEPGSGAGNGVEDGGDLVVVGGHAGQINPSISKRLAGTPSGRAASSEQNKV